MKIFSFFNRKKEERFPLSLEEVFQKNLTSEVIANETIVDIIVKSYQNPTIERKFKGIKDDFEYKLLKAYEFIFNSGFKILTCSGVVIENREELDLRIEKEKGSLTIYTEKKKANQ